MKQVVFSKNIYSLLATATLSMLLASCNANAHQPTQAPPNTSSSSSITAMVDTRKYTDGTYAANGTYEAPSGMENIDVSLTLKNNTITDATVKPNAMGGRSMMYQQAFASGFKDQVIGKSINDLSLTVVNGSSLTPMGFMDAVEKIKAQAVKA